MSKRPLEPELELGKRCGVGGLSYLGLLGVVHLAEPVELTAAMPSYLPFSWAIIALSVLRIGLSLGQSAFYPVYRKAWIRAYDVTALAAGVCWGLLGAGLLMAGRSEPSSPSATIALVTIAGISSGAMTSLYPRKWLARAYLATLLLPVIFVEFNAASVASRAIACVTGIFLAYLWVQVRHSHEAYWTALHNRDALQFEKERLELVMHASRTGIVDRNLWTGRPYVSPSLESILGLKPDNIATVLELSLAAVARRERVEFELEVNRGGEPRFFYVMAHPIFNSRGGAIDRLVSSVTDITETKKLAHAIELQKAQMIASSRLSSLGEMAGGIAHEINTPLGVISLRVDELESWLQTQGADRSQPLDSIRVIQKTVDRIAKIITGLRYFAREGRKLDRGPVQLATLMKDTLALCRERFASRGVLLELSPATIPADLQIECQPVEISQILVNLLNNAFDAVMPLPQKWVRIEVLDRGAAVEVRVVDSGKGIPEDLGKRIMDPFFTTKEIGKGTGLGLSISKGIAEAHHGQLILDRFSPNTCFKLTLPKRQPLEQAA